MKVIALQGTADSGKTSTLKKLIALLCSEGHPLACGKKKKAYANIPELAIRLKEDGDLWVILNYHNKIVAVTTEGDEWPVIDATINKIQEVATTQGLNIDVLICAIHSGDKMLNQLKSLYSDPHIVQQYKADMDNFLEITSQISNLSQAVILKNIVRFYVL